MKKEENDKEVRYLSNHLWGYFLVYQIKCGNQGGNDQEMYINEDFFTQILIGVEETDKMVRKMRTNFYKLDQTMASHSTSTKKLEAKVH